MPFRSGRPSTVRGARYVSPWPAAGGACVQTTAVIPATTATPAAMQRKMRIGTIVLEGPDYEGFVVRNAMTRRDGAAGITCPARGRLRVSTGIIPSDRADVRAYRTKDAGLGASSWARPLPRL